MFESLTSNQFLTMQISEDNFDKLVKSHIERTSVIAANSSPLTAMFWDNRTAVSALYTQYSESRGKKALNLSQKEGKTINVNQIVKNIKVFVSLKEGIIKNKFFKGTAEYEEFYPLGVKEYAKASKKNIGNLFKRFIDSLNVHKMDLDSGILSEALPLYDSLMQAMSAQMNQVGNVKDITSSTKELRRQLAVQLYKNMLLLLLMNADNPQKVKDYFDESFIKHASKKAQVVEQAASKVQ